MSFRMSRRGERGFTLLETLLGLAILSGVLIATYSALSHALSAASRVMARQLAADAAEAAVTGFRLHPRARDQSVTGETALYHWQVSSTVLSPAAAGRMIPLRITAVISRKAPAAAPETVLDTIIMVSQP